MRYAESAASRYESLLEDGQTRESVADECRQAALDFMAGVADGWSKFDLALWLRGPYALASRHSQRGDRAPAPHVKRKQPIELMTLEQLLVSARGQILAALELAALVGGTPDFIEDALIEQHVRRAVDMNGESLWVPVDVARMRLKDRVASLFVADYLNRPSDYQNLAVCHSCESVNFDASEHECSMKFSSRWRCNSRRLLSELVKRPA